MNRILIIDDDAELCALVARFLGGEGFAIDRAANGSEGIARALSEKYALIMLDDSPGKRLQPLHDGKVLIVCLSRR